MPKDLPTVLSQTDHAPTRPGSRFLQIWVFFIGIGSYLDLNIAGRITVSELLMAVLLPYLCFTSTLVRRLSTFWLLLLLAVLAVTISDLLVNRVGVDRYYRGVARLVFFALIASFWALVLSRDFRLLVIYMWGTLPGAVVNLFRVSEFDRETVVVGSGGYDFWATKVSPVLIALSTLIAFYLHKRFRWGGALVLFLGAAINAVFASRSKAASLFVAAIASFRIKTQPAVPARVSRGQALLILGLAASFVYAAYVYTAPRGYLGEYQRQKFEEQTRSIFGATPWGILLGGRVDMLECILAIKDSPWWGAGSWSIPRRYLLEAHELLGFPRSRSLENNVNAMGESAGHSVIFGSWASSGFLVLPLWGYILWLASSTSSRIVRTPSALIGFLTVLAINTFFMLAFNPFSLSSRNTIGLFVGIGLALRSMPERRYVDNSGRFLGRHFNAGTRMIE